MQSCEVVPSCLSVTFDLEDAHVSYKKDRKMTKQTLRQRIPSYWREWWDERVAIMQCDGELPLEQAQEEATECLRIYRTTHASQGEYKPHPRPHPLFQIYDKHLPLTPAIALKPSPKSLFRFQP